VAEWIVAMRSEMAFGDGGRVVCIVCRIDGHAKGIAYDELPGKSIEKTTVVKDR